MQCVCWRLHARYCVHVREIVREVVVGVLVTVCVFLTAGEIPLHCGER